MSRVFYPQARVILQVIFDSFDDDDESPLVIPVMPKSLTVHKNSYKQADSWEITFDANDLPLDPDLIRSGAAEIYLFQTSGIRGDQRVVSRQDPTVNDPTGFRPRDPIDEIQLELGLPNATDAFTLGNKPMVAGLFDEDSLTIDESGKWVTITGQDYTAYLASIQWPPTDSGRARKIPVGSRVDTLLTELLGEADPDGRLRLVVKNVDPTSLPIVGAAEISGNRRGIPVEQDTTYWDVMYKVATRYGLIIFVDGLDVVLSRPQNITSADLGRILQFEVGSNIDSLQLSRSMGKEQVPTVVVQGYDPKLRRTISVEYPEGSRSLTAKTTKGDVKKTSSSYRITTKEKRPKKHGKGVTPIRKKDEFEIFPMYGISDPVVLRNAAKNLFHLLGRAERKCVLRTNDLKDLDETNLFAAAAGTAVAIAFNDYNRELLANPAIPLQAKVDHLMSRGYNETVAQVWATTFDKLEALRRPLRTREATFEYDVDNGVSIELELVDFVVVGGNRQEGDRQTRSETREERLRHADGTRIGLGGSVDEENARLGQLRPR